MGMTKRQYVDQAFTEIGLAGYVFDITPEEMNTALRQLGQLRTNLEYRSAPNILANLTNEMHALQDGIGQVSEAISARYFPANVLPTWIGEVS